MADKTHIEWTDATWNPITGCSVVSPGCTNCYAMKLAGTRLKHHPSRRGLTTMSKAGPVWNGEVRFNENWLDQPLRWTKPRRIFVCAHGDLFHESVPDEWIDKVFAVMALAPQHTFQVLTKRPDRMRDYCNGITSGPRAADIARHVDVLSNDETLACHFMTEQAELSHLPNVWLGTSVEDQTRADERIPDLLRTPAAVRFLSCEPLLGPVDLRNHKTGGMYGREVYDWLSGVVGVRNGGGGWYSGPYQTLDGETRDCQPKRPVMHDGRPMKIDWVIAGGESGPGARPSNPQWFRDLRDQCLEAGVPFHFKQWGEWITVSESQGPGEIYKFEDHRAVRRVGKKAAGRLLDGVTHDGFPGAA